MTKNVRPQLSPNCHVPNCQQKIRDTANRINGLERVNNDLRSENSISNNHSISPTEQNSNTQNTQTSSVDIIQYAENNEKRQSNLI